MSCEICYAEHILILCEMSDLTANSKYLMFVVPRYHQSMIITEVIRITQRARRWSKNTRTVVLVMFVLSIEVLQEYDDNVDDQNHSKSRKEAPRSGDNLGILIAP